MSFSDFRLIDKFRQTRMHSSRMCTVRNSSHLLVGGAWSPRGCLLLGWVPGPVGVTGPGGVPGPGGICSRGCLVPGGWGGIPACTEADPLCEQNDRQV